MNEAQGGAVLTTDVERPYVPSYMFRQVQNWLERYHDMIRYIDDAEQEAIHGSTRLGPEEATPPGRSAKLPSDPTGVRGARLADDWELQQCRLRVRAIRETLDGLESVKRDIVRVYYWESRQRTTWRAVAAIVGADERTCRRWRDGIVREIAGRMPKGSAG